MNIKAQKPEIQEMVLSTAAGLIAKKGLKGWNTAELARDCGLAKNTLYKIIGSKEELIESIVLGQIDATNNLLKKIIRQSGDYRSAALGMLEAGPRFLSGRPRVTFPEIFREYPALAAKALRHQKRAASEIIDFIRRGQRENHIRSDIEPDFLYDLVRGIVDHYTRSGLEGEALSKALYMAFTCLREGVRLGDW